MQIPDIIFSAGLDRALAWTVVHAIWQATLIAFTTGIVLIALRHKSAQTRYWVANLALLAVLATSIATFSWYLQAPAPEQAAPAVAEASSLQPAAVHLITPVPSPVPEPPTVSNGQAFKDYFNLHLPLIVLLWSVGMAIFLLRLLGSLLKVYALKQRMNFSADPYWSELLDKLVQKSGMRQTVSLLESALVRSPLTIGHLKPLILFPIGVINRLSEQEVEAILAHELAHILRRDYLFNILQSLIEALFYFHPAIWWLSAQVRNEREHACDDRAIALLGNKINYAKALVAIQEMAYYPQTPALAFAGARKSQLLRRVQRLFSQPKTSFNIMEKWISTAFVVCLVFMLAFGQHFQNNLTPGNLTETSESSVNTGIWEAEFTRDSVNLTLTRREQKGAWAIGEDFPKKSFSNLTVADGETNFQLLRAAGKMSFTGKIEGTTGYGRYTFAPDESYRAALTQQGILQPDDELLLQCFFADFGINYVAAVKNLGFQDLDKDRLLQLAAFRLSEQSIKSYQDLAASLDKKELDFDELIQLKVANVTSEQVKSLTKAGYTDLDLEAISQLSLQEVDPAYIAEMNNAGLGKLSGEELLNAKIQGIDAGFIKQAQNLGLGKLDFDEIMNLKIQDIDPEFIKQAQDMGLGKLDFDEIMNLKIQNIDADFIKEAQDMGLGKLDFDQIMNLKIQGIDADFVKKAQDMGLGKLDFDQIMNLKIQNIDADFIKQAQNMGFGELSFDEIMTLKIHDIDAGFIKQAQALGLGKLSFEDLIQIKIFDITPELVKTYRDLDFKNLTVEELVAAKTQDVTPEFIREAGKKGYKFPNLSEYAELKVRMEMRSRKEN